MNIRTWNSPLVTFLSGGNTVILRSTEEFKEFSKQMEVLGIDVSSLNRANTRLGLLVEYNNGKGVTFWNHDKPIGQAIQESKKWYEIDPYTWEEIKINDLDLLMDIDSKKVSITRHREKSNRQLALERAFADIERVD